MSGRDVHEAHEVHKSTILTDREKGWLQQDWDEQAEADSCTSKATINNLILLEPSLRVLGVPFDAQIAFKMMQGIPGTASKLLYQVKMVLDRLSKFCVPVSMRPTISPGTVKPIPNLPQKATKVQYDRVMHTIFAASVRDMVRSQKSINLERSLKRFEDEGARQKRVIYIRKERSLLAAALHTEAIRAQGRHDLAKRKVLCGSWEGDNVGIWMKNMARKRARREQDWLFLRKLDKIRRSRLVQARMASQGAVKKDLQQFAVHRLESMSTGENREERETQPWIHTAVNEGFLEAGALDRGYQWQMARFHEQRSGERADARERRRRRYTTEQEESLSSEYVLEGADILKGKLMKSCRAEHQLANQLESVFRYKSITTENRRYRSQQYAARADVDMEGLFKRDQTSLDSFRYRYDLGVKVQLERCEAAGATRLVAMATRIEKICHEILDGIIALSIEAVLYRICNRYCQGANSITPDQDPAPRPQWIEMKRSFVRGGPLLRIESLTSPTAREWGCTSLAAVANDSVGDGRSADTIETVEQVARFLDDCEFQDYINGAGLWSTKDDHASGEAIISSWKIGSSLRDGLLRHSGSVGGMNPSDYASGVDITEIVQAPYAASSRGIPATADPVHALGECVIDVNLAANPLPASEAPPAVPRFNLRICLCGSILAGKSEQAIRLAERYCLKVLSAEEIAQKAIENAARAMTANLKVLSRQEALGQVASSALLQGGTISDEVYAALLVLAIKNLPQNQGTAAKLGDNSKDERKAREADQDQYMGWIIDDFPNTARQAALLEKHLSGYDETAYVPSRSDAGSTIAPGASVTKSPEDKKFVNSGIDLVIFIEVPREIIVKRSLGRITDPVTCEQYHFEGSLPPYDVVCKERLVRPEDPANSSAQLALQVATQEESSQDLKQFIGRFGTLRIVEGEESTSDVLFGKINSVVMDMINKPEVSQISGCDDGREDADKGSTQGLHITDANEMGSSEEGGAHFLPADLAETLSGCWRAAEEHFKETARRVFRESRNQRLLVGSYMRGLRESFSVFLHRPDNKQTILTDLCSSFNAMNQDLRFDDRACKELLVRVEECRSRLWFDVEERRASAEQALKAIRQNGWVERQKAMIYNHLMVLMQAEVECFHAGTSLLQDYHDTQFQAGGSRDSIALAELLPWGRGTEGPIAKGGKKDKSNKGGAKKALDSSTKGGKGGKGNTTSDPPSGTPEGRTPLPPCLITSTLVDNVGCSTRFSHATDNPAENAGMPAQLKGKLDRSEIFVKKSCIKGEAIQVDEMPSPLAAALEMVLTYAEAWGPDSFPMCQGVHPPPISASALHSARVDRNNSEERMTRRPSLSSPFPNWAIWPQAGILAARARLLHRVGEELAMNVQQESDEINQELQRSVDRRVSEESCAVEVAMSAARECILKHKPIDLDWKLEGGVFEVDANTRLVANQLTTPIMENAEDFAVLNSVQEDRLRSALSSIRYISEDGNKKVVVSLQAAVDVLLRLAEEDDDLRFSWAGIHILSPTLGIDESLSRVLDPHESGQIEVEDVVRFLTWEKL